MSKYLLRINLSEMYACKHAVEIVLNQKIQRLEEINNKAISEVDIEAFEEREKLEKDILQEQRLLARLAFNIARYREKNGSNRYIQ